MTTSTTTRGRSPAPFSVKPEAATAWRNLGAVLNNLTDVGVEVPCQVVPGPFVSDSPKARTAAARWCSGCPAVVACDAFAVTNAEPFGVWAGIDRSPRPKTPRIPESTEEIDA